MSTIVLKLTHGEVPLDSHSPSRVTYCLPCMAFSLEFGQEPSYSSLTTSLSGKVSFVHTVSTFSAWVNTSSDSFAGGDDSEGELALIASSAVCLSHLSPVLVIQLEGGEMLALVPEASLGFSELGYSLIVTCSESFIHSLRV